MKKSLRSNRLFCPLTEAKPKLSELFEMFRNPESFPKCLIYSQIHGIIFYHEISEHELFDICTGQLSDVSEMANIIKDWTHRHQELMDERL